MMDNHTTNVESVSVNVNSAGEQSSDNGWTRIKKSRNQTIKPRVTSPYLTRSSTRTLRIAGTDYATFNTLLKVIHPILLQAHVPQSQTWLQPWKTTIMKTSSWKIIRHTFHLQTLHDLYTLLITCSEVKQQLHLQMTTDKKISYAFRQQPLVLSVQDIKSTITHLQMTTDKKVGNYIESAMENINHTLSDLEIAL
jgi:hypothetical protein